jgi:hypothetical protein
MLGIVFRGPHLPYTTELMHTVLKLVKWLNVGHRVWEPWGAPCVGSSGQILSCSWLLSHWLQVFLTTWHTERPFLCLYINTFANTFRIRYILCYNTQPIWKGNLQKPKPERGRCGIHQDAGSLGFTGDLVCVVWGVWHVWCVWCVVCVVVCVCVVCRRRGVLILVSHFP